VGDRARARKLISAAEAKSRGTVPPCDGLRLIALPYGYSLKSGSHSRSPLEYLKMNATTDARDALRDLFQLHFGSFRFGAHGWLPPLLAALVIGALAVLLGGILFCRTDVGYVSPAFRHSLAYRAVLVLGGLDPLRLRWGFHHGAALPQNVSAGSIEYFLAYQTDRAAVPAARPRRVRSRPDSPRRGSIVLCSSS
jgi:hypothetical protein